MVLDTGLEGKILTSAGDNAFRWQHGERLEDLFEDHCDARRRGSLAATGNGFARRGAGLPLAHTTPLPYDQAASGENPDFAWHDRLLEDPGSGLDLPAAVIVECVQGEGGINVASAAWLRGLAERCQRHGILLIVGGYGLPLALTMFRPELDVWVPGEHTGTFRGFDPALITGGAALRAYWSDSELETRTAATGERVATALAGLAGSVPGASARGRGLAQGLELAEPGLAQKVAAAAFDLGLLVETAGSADQVVKLLPPLTASDDEPELGLSMLASAVTSAAA
jgi:diaminobutyrate-2-oxoglutarate transaminase